MWSDGRLALRQPPPTWHHTHSLAISITSLGFTQRSDPPRDGEEKTPVVGRAWPRELCNAIVFKARHIVTPAKLWLGRDGLPPSVETIRCQGGMALGLGVTSYGLTSYDPLFCDIYQYLYLYKI